MSPSHRPAKETGAFMAVKFQQVAGEGSIYDNLIMGSGEWIGGGRQDPYDPWFDRVDPLQDDFFWSVPDLSVGPSTRPPDIYFETRPSIPTLVPTTPQASPGRGSIETVRPRQLPDETHVYEMPVITVDPNNPGMYLLEGQSITWEERQQYLTGAPLPGPIASEEDSEVGILGDIYDTIDTGLGGILPGGVPLSGNVFPAGQAAFPAVAPGVTTGPVVSGGPVAVPIPGTGGPVCATDDPMKGMVYKKVAGQYRWVKQKRSRRRALATKGDLKDLASLKGVLGQGKAFEVWIANSLLISFFLITREVFMAGIIVLSDQEAATNADILQATRLQTVPASGYLLFELQASDNDATNNYTVSIQMPGGDTPLNATRIPCGTSTGLAGVIDDRTALRLRFRIAQGGHCTFSCTETGDSELTWRVTYQPLSRT